MVRGGGNKFHSGYIFKKFESKHCRGEGIFWDVLCQCSLFLLLTSACLFIVVQQSCIKDFLIFLGESAYVAKEFFLAIDGVVLAHCTDVVSAVGAMFAVYFVFNIKYNKNISGTLEFIQRYVL